MQAAAVKQWLQQQHINVPSDWLDACITWIRENDDEFSEGKLNYLVYEQWVASDLRELQLPCLPPDLSSHQKLQFSGYFALQVNFVMDISQSSYSQIQKLRKDDIANASISAEPVMQAQWEPKPTRLLMLTMTDGLQTVRGMEYKPVPDIDVNIVPGTKVLIYGDLECRLGVILLNKDNIRILGGEVENLLEVNSMQNVLLRTLGQETSGLQSLATNIPAAVSSNVNSFANSFEHVETVNELTNQNSINNIVANDNRNTATNLDQTASNAEVSIANVNTSVARKYQETVVDVMNEAYEFPDDDDMADFEEEIKLLERSAHEVEVDQTYFTSSNNCGTANAGNKNSLNEIKIKEIDEKDFMDNNSVFESEMNETNANASGFNWQNKDNSRRKTFPLFSRNMSNSPYFNLQSVKMTSKNPTQKLGRSLSSKSSKLSNTAQKNSHHSDHKSSESSVSGCSNLNLHKNKMNSSERQTSDNLDEFLNTSDVFNDSVFIDLTDDEETERNKKADPDFMVMNKNNSFTTVDHLVKTTDVSTKEPFARSCSSNKVFCSNQKEINDAVPSTSRRQGSASFFTDTCRSETRKNKLNSVKSGKQKSKLVMKPFTYISQILKNPCEEQITYTCRAFIVTLLTRLESNENGWNLQVKLNDGTASLDAALSNKLLEHLIGFKADCIKLIKKKENINLRINVMEGLQKCRRSLINFSGLLELEMNPESKPCITGLKELTLDYGITLQDIVCSQLQ